MDMLNAEDDDPWDSWRRWEDYPKTEWKDVRTLKSTVDKRKKLPTYERSEQILQALQLLFSDR